jgi:hypothetical protein
MFISVATVMVYTSSYVDATVAFYNDHMSDVNDTDDFMVGISTIMDLEYFQKDPVYQFSVNTGDYQFTLGIYHFGYTYNKKLNDGIMIFINDIQINYDGLLLENPITKLELSLSDQTYKERGAKDKTDLVVREFNPSKSVTAAYLPVLFLLYDEDNLRKTDGTYSTIDSIKLGFSTGELDQNSQLIYNTLFFTSIDLQLIDETVLNNEAEFVDYTYQFNHTDFQLTNLFNLSNDKQYPTEVEILTYQLIIEKGPLGDYNYIIWRSMSLYILIVILITYILFFHKIVKEKYFNKKYPTKTKDLKTIQERSIFKDDDLSNKDGK